MKTIAVYAESGGVTKTTTAVSLATVLARAGRRVIVCDLDPRAAASTWLRAEPIEPGWHSGAILGDDNAAEWISDVLVECSWSKNLRVIPAARSLSTREESAGDNDLRLRRSLAALTDADLIVLDLPNRQGGPIIRNALNATDRLVYAANPSPDGVAGVEGARRSVDRFKAGRREIGAPEQVEEIGVIVGAYRSSVPARIDRAGIERLRSLATVLDPIVPHRAIVQEARAAGEWYGDYAKGRPVAEAYEALAQEVTA